MPIRIDVFSSKGGVGKTLLSVCLARQLAADLRRPSLIVDADLTGTCLGDVLEAWARPTWRSTFNLTHLVCGRPELVMDWLAQDSGNRYLPVYDWRPAMPPGDPKPRPLGRRATPGELGQPSAPVVFCPSSPSSSDRTMPRVERAVLHAMLGHESAAGWVTHVVDETIAETDRRIEGGLGSVLVDHGPGFGALQWASLRALLAQRDSRRGRRAPDRRRAVVVTSRDRVDLDATGDLSAELGPEASARVSWVVNRLPGPVVADWRQAIPATYRPSATWFDEAFPVHDDAALAESYAASESDKLSAPGVTRICQRILR